MKHEIDLSKYEVRTDLIIESIGKKKVKGISKKNRNIDGIIIDEVDINEYAESHSNKKKGKYITISFNDVTDTSNYNKVKEVFTKEFKSFLKYMNIIKDNKCLVIGMGNSKSTPDSLGPKSLNNLIVTKHLFDIDSIEVLDDYRNVSSFIPGVLGITGIETKDSITGIIKETKPDFVIIIDALASSSIDRVNKTIQMTNTGINPGSGIGNSRGELSFETLGVPVIAIGVPTVVDAVTIVSDTINYLMKKFSYSKNNINNVYDKLKPITSINYLKDENENLSMDERKKLLGYIGNLSDMEVKQLIFEVLTPIGYNMMVTPKEVDFLIDRLSTIISDGLNTSLHNNIKKL